MCQVAASSSLVLKVALCDGMHCAKSRLDCSYTAKRLYSV